VDEIAARSRDGLRRMKFLIDSGLEHPTESALEQEQLVAARHTESPNYAEGLQAFRGKRRPRFSS
jgi:enoyl-CoA hydratase/carnithine racemase